MGEEEGRPQKPWKLSGEVMLRAMQPTTLGAAEAVLAVAERPHGRLARNRG